MIATYPIRELHRIDASELAIVPGAMVEESGCYTFDQEVINDIDAGRGIVISVFLDEYVPNSDGPGPVATVLWSRPPTINGKRKIDVPYLRYEIIKGRKDIK